MRFPVMNEIKQTTDGVTAFSGYDHRMKTKQNAFHDMMNMSGELLPVMSTRRKREYLRTLEKPNGLFAHDKMCWVDGTDFYYNGMAVGKVTDSEKQMVRMGAYVLIWPDAKYYNSQTGEFGSLGASFTTYSDVDVKCSICLQDGEAFPSYTVASTAPSNPANGQYWLDTSVTPNVLRYYSTTQTMWQSVPTVYTKIASTGIGKAFAKYDGIEISGMEVDALNGSFYVVNRSDDYLIVVAMINQNHTQTARVTVERKVPQMDYVCELDNRIWGCSSEKHEIYACALGDPKNWNQFMGLSGDSYAVTVGSSGAFTGACGHAGHVLFFKEDAIHTIMGTKPANFQLDTTECRGVMSGCSKSLVTVNETLLFKNRYDVCRFGSALPSSVSDALGSVNYNHAVAGAVDGKYFICMRDVEGAPHLFVFDTSTGVWVKEDHADVLDFATLNGQMYMLLTNGQLWCVNGTGADVCRDEDAHTEGEGEAEMAPEWMLETGDIGLDEPFNHYISGIQIHAECELGTNVRMEIRCDTDPVWDTVLTCSPVTRRSLTIPYVPRRCRTMRIRLSGNGGFKLYSIIKRTEVGSDVYGTA